MCKKFIQGLFGGGSSKPAVAQPATPITTTGADRNDQAEVKTTSTDIADGRESSGRVRLGKSSDRRRSASVGLGM